MICDFKEEKYLSDLTGEKYIQYCKKVHRFFPSIKHLSQSSLRKIVNLKEAFSTNEKRGLWSWPILAVVLESFQEWLIFEETIFAEPIEISGKLLYTPPPDPQEIEFSLFSLISTILPPRVLTTSLGSSKIRHHLPR